MKIQTKQLSEIKPYWRNARKNDKTVEGLKQSIKSYGYTQPINIDENGVILIGHARYIALTQLGYTEATVIVLDYLSEKQKKEYRIADNKLHELTTWINEDLVLEMREINNNEDMQSYFPNINLGNWLEDSIGFNVEDITKENVDQKAEEIYGTMTNRNNAHIDETIDVMCPHCMEEFALRKADL